MKTQESKYYLYLPVWSARESAEECLREGEGAGVCTIVMYHRISGNLPPLKHFLQLTVLLDFSKK